MSFPLDFTPETNLSVLQRDARAFFAVQGALLTDPLVVAMYYLTLTLGVIAIGCNLVVAVSLATRIRELQPSLLFIISLAMGDVVNGVSALYHFLLVYAEVAPRCTRTCLARIGIQVLAFKVVSVEVFNISLDRWVRCIAPLRYAAIVTHKVALAFVAFNWLTAVAFALAGPFTKIRRESATLGGAAVDEFYAQYRCIAPNWSAGTVVALCAFLLLPILTALALYIYIYLFVTCRRQVAVADQRHNRRAFVSIALIVGVFSATYLPVLLYAVLVGSGVAQRTWHVGQRFSVAGFLFPVVASALNPVIYVYRYPDARACLARAFARVRRLLPTTQHCCHGNQVMPCRDGYPTSKASGSSAHDGATAARGGSESSRGGATAETRAEMPEDSLAIELAPGGARASSSESPGGGADGCSQDERPLGGEQDADSVRQDEMML
ncbi:PREDICTED: adenosine receptor A2b-like [Priapulus caudatus]|uniref:Adenosine receptor A2b-like n=1 Tax=Priapulus caudatus TaxID=37621 RepID=A0ABM1EQ79_PRICU|nr:PREDICTED: adenosine receptor A2b-like [Priapulus caudatus]